MDSKNRTVWSDEVGDLRKKSKNPTVANDPVIDKNIVLSLRRLTSGKGRTVIEISGLPNNKAWCETLAKDLKKALGVGGTFKNQCIEIHGEKIEKVMAILDQKSIRWKKTGG